MYNIKALEEEWKRYNRKKKRPWIIAGVFFLMTGLFLFFGTNYRTFFDSLLAEKSTGREITGKSVPAENIFLDAALAEPEKKDAFAGSDVPILDDSSDDGIESSMSAEKKDETKKFQIEVVEINNKDAYKEVEKRFRLGHDVDDSLFLAKAYYLKGQYKKAEYWALQTNKINENIEESWLIFAKAKVKRGQKNEAMRILEAFINRSDSSEAKVLLEKIKKGAI